MRLHREPMIDRLAGAPLIRPLVIRRIRAGDRAREAARHRHRAVYPAHEMLWELDRIICLDCDAAIWRRGWRRTIRRRYRRERRHAR